MFPNLTNLNVSPLRANVGATAFPPSVIEGRVEAPTYSMFSNLPITMDPALSAGIAAPAVSPFETAPLQTGVVPGLSGGASEFLVAQAPVLSAENTLVSTDDPALDIEASEAEATVKSNYEADLADHLFERPFEILPQEIQSEVLNGITRLYDRYYEFLRKQPKFITFKRYLQNETDFPFQKVQWISEVFDDNMVSIMDLRNALEEDRRRVAAEIEEDVELLLREKYRSPRDEQRVRTQGMVYSTPWYQSNITVGIALAVLPIFLWNVVKSFASAGTEINQAALASKLVRDIVNLYKGSPKFELLSADDKQLMIDVSAAVAKFARKNPGASDSQFIDAMLTLYGPRFNRFLELSNQFIEPRGVPPPQPVQGFGRAHSKVPTHGKIIVGIVRIRERRYI